VTNKNKILPWLLSKGIYVHITAAKSIL